MSPPPPPARSDGPVTEAERLRRRVLWTMPAGLYLVGSADGPRANLMTANWVMQVAMAPVLVATALERDSATAALVAAGGGFSVSILDRADRSVVRRFVKPVTDVERDPSGRLVTLQGEAVRDEAGLPVLARAVAWFRCELRREVQWDGPGDPSEGGGMGAASHALFVGEVVEAGFGPDQVDPDEAGSSATAVPEHPEVLRMEDTRMHYGG